MTEYTRFIKNLRLVYSVSLITLFLRLAYNIIVARILLPEAFGLLAFVLAIEQILFIIIDGGGSILIIQDKDQENKSVSNYGKKKKCNFNFGIRLIE